MAFFATFPVSHSHQSLSPLRLITCTLKNFYHLLTQAFAYHQLDSSQLFYCASQIHKSYPTHHILLDLYKASKNARPIHIYPKDGNCTVCQNIRKPSTFDAKASVLVYIKNILFLFLL